MYKVPGTRPALDERDEQIRQERIKLWNTRGGPRVGDFVKMPDGSTRRFTFDWSGHAGDGGMQTTSGFQPGDQSFHFGSEGYMSYSGSLDPSIPVKDLHDTGEVKDGSCWFFHHGSVEAHNGVYTTVPCRVYEYKPAPLMLKWQRREWINAFCRICHVMRKSDEEFRPALALRDALLDEIPEVVYAVPGSDTIIDLVFDESGLTHCYGKTLAEVQKEYPDAVLMTLDEFCKAKAARQDSPIQWLETDEKTFHDMLEVLPPIAFDAPYTAFLVGEPCDHHAGTGRPRYQGFVTVGKRYYKTSRPVTVKEFRTLKRPD
jgi:hypothetical protein